jgi:hypothetical protein
MSALSCKASKSSINKVYVILISSTGCVDNAAACVRKAGRRGRANASKSIYRIGDERQSGAKSAAKNIKKAIPKAAKSKSAS